MKPLLVLLALLLAACAAPKPEPIIRRAEAVPAPVEILISTSPAGGLVDWNGNVLGTAPVTLKLTPQMFNGLQVWPYNGAHTQYIRARWPDGSAAVERFDSNQALPQAIGIVSPFGRNPLLEIIAAQNKNLTQKKGP
jgi:hypothetical protein